jgi:hypothetical protein
MLRLSSDNKKNLEKYSPFYRCLLNFADEKHKILIYVPSYFDFNASEPLRKIKAFDIDGKFEAKKIIFANLHHLRGEEAGHWDVTVKNPGSYDSCIFDVAGDGNCGLISSILMLNQVFDNSHIQLRNLIRVNQYGQRALATLNSGEIKQNLHLQSSSSIFIDDAGLKGGLWLRQDKVHQILTQYPAVQSDLQSGVIKDMTPSTMQSVMDTVHSSFFQDFVDARNTNADNDLDFITNKTLKNEFKNIVINIIYENKESLEWNTNLEEMVENKLGQDFTRQIKAELGGEISFETLFSFETDTLTRGFFGGRMNNEAGAKEAVEKIAEIFEHYLNKEIVYQSDFKKILIFQDVCQKAMSEELGLDRDKIAKFPSIQGKLKKYSSQPSGLYEELLSDAVRKKQYGEFLRKQSLIEKDDSTIMPLEFDDCYGEEGFPYSPGPILAKGSGMRNYRQPPLRQPQPKKPNDDQDCLTALGSALGDFVDGLINICSPSGNNSDTEPKKTPQSRQQENFLETISAFFCPPNRRK